VIVAGLMSVIALGIGGCESTKQILEIGEAAEKNPGPCPVAFALHDASRMVEFKGKESYKNVGFTAEITNVRSVCRYYGEQPIVADLDMEMSFGRGPAAAHSAATYQYFVSVTRKDIEVIKKETFPITVTFPPNVNTVNVMESVGQIIIPRANENTSGANFEIIVGFELTQEQIAFNAEGKRFRVSAGQN